MKKLCIALCLILLFMSIAPFSVHAEDSVLTHDELIALSCSVFPEYADNITNPQIRTSSTYSLSDPLVVSETREVPDGGTMTYQEFASGYAFLTFYQDWTRTNSSSSNQIVGSLYVTCNLSAGYFLLADFTYVINDNGYDYIVDHGEYSDISDCVASHGSNSTFEKDYENASGPAYSLYTLLFYPFDYSMVTTSSCNVYLKVGNDVLEIIVNGTSVTYSY